MYNPISIKLLDFLLALSESLDLFNPLLAQHQIRTAFIAWKIGEAYQLDPLDLENLITAALLHDIGALTPEDKVALHESEYDEDIHKHCIIGEKLLCQSPLFEVPSRIIRYHHTSWQDWEQSDVSQLAVQSQILYLADVIERAIHRHEYILYQNRDINELVNSMSGVEFHPDVVDAYKSISSTEEFWFDLVSQYVREILRDYSPNRNTLIYQKDFLGISEMLRKIIDFRSHFTSTHSTGVSSAAAIISGLMGYSDIEIEMMELAGNVHDLGKLAVPNNILQKSGELTEREFSVVRQHTYHTYSILRRCGLPENIIEWAGFHHEKLNGSGYPFHLGSEQISGGSRIITVADILIALAENRPYRDGMKKEEVLSILGDMTRTKDLDPYVVGVLNKNFDEIVEPTMIKQQNVEAQFYDEHYHQ